MKFLVVLVVVWVVYRIWGPHAHRRFPPSAGRTAGAGPRPQTARVAGPQDMVPCARCGRHVPRQEVVQAHGQSFCCTEHAEAGAVSPASQDARRP